MGINKTVILSLVIAISILFSFAVVYAYSYKQSDFLELESNTDKCLVNCEAIIKIKNPTPNDIALSNNDLTRWYVKSPGARDLQAFGWQIEKTKSKVVQDYTTNCKDVEYNSPNGTYTVEECTTTSSGTHTEYYKEWEEFNPDNFVLESGESYRIKIYGTKKPTTRSSVDWKIKLKTALGNFEPDWAWWYDIIYQYKKPMQIEPRTNASLPNFPVWVEFDTQTLISEDKLLSNCSDLDVINGTEDTELYFQFDNTTHSTTGCNTGNTGMWIKLEGLPETQNATGYVYYGNDTAGPSKTSSNVWSDYEAVYHDGLSNAAPDSSYDLTQYGTGSDWNSSGKFGYAFESDGTTSSYFQSNSCLTCLETEGTIEFWAYLNDLENYVFVVEGTTCSPDDCLLIDLVGEYIYFLIIPQLSPWLKSNSKITSGRWYYVVVTWDSSSMKLYINGTDDVADRSAPTSDFTWTKNMAIAGNGGIDGVGFGFNGRIDEVRVHNVAKSAEYIEASYKNGLKNYYFGAEMENVTVENNPPYTPSPILTPTTPTGGDDLTCSFLAADPEADTLTAEIDWMKNNISTLNYSIANIANGTTVNTVLAFGNTTKGELWNCQARLFDGEFYSNYSNSSQVLILNTKPTHTTPILEASTIDNTTNDELTCYNQSTFDADNDKITNIYTWLKNSQGLGVLNLPFESNANDYSGADNNGTIYGATFTNGKVGKALSFDGANDKVSVGNLGIPADGTATIEGWFNFKQFASESSYRGLYSILYQHPTNNHLYITGTNDFFNVASSLQKNTWHHIVLTYSGDTSTAKLYLDNNEIGITVQAGPQTIPALSSFKVADTGYNEFFNGSIDEVKVYNRVLSEEQISKHYNLGYDKIVSQETSADEVYQCKITPNDAEEDGTTLSSNSITINPAVYTIMFNAIDSFTGTQLPSPIDKIVCTNGLNVISEPNPAGPYKFFEGPHDCTFTKVYRYNKTITFTADANKTVDVPMSESHLTLEEHSWLEALYTCLIGGNCSAYDLWLSTNETVEKIWDQVKPTDQTVIVSEQIINQTLSPTSNITIDYTINVPTKEGYGTGDFLPLRIAYWFVDTNNESCLSQDKQTDSNRAEAPFCIPLFAHTLGKVNYQTNFTVDLRPNLPDGTYNIVRRLEIDPPANHQPVWFNYGQEVVGTVTVTQSDGNILVNLIKTGEDKIKSSFLSGAFALNLDAIANPSFALGVFITLAALSFILNGWFYFKRKKAKGDE